MNRDSQLPSLDPSNKAILGEALAAIICTTVTILNPIYNLTGDGSSAILYLMTGIFLGRLAERLHLKTKIEKLRAIDTGPFQAK